MTDKDRNQNNEISKKIESITSEINKLTDIEYPQIEERKIIDEAARLVSKNGFAFEDKLKKDAEVQPKLSFLLKDHKYKPYYDMKVNEFLFLLSNNEEVNPYSKENIERYKEINNQEFLRKKIMKEKEDNKNSNSNNNNEFVHKTIITSNLSQIKELLNSQENDNRDEIITYGNNNKPDKVNFDFNAYNNFTFASNNFKLNLKHTINQQQDDLIKITAQFIAKNGQGLLNIIQKREINNKAYDFLKPTNQLFPYFNDILKSYTNCLFIKSELKSKLETYSNMNSMLWSKEELVKESFKKRLDCNLSRYCCENNNVVLIKAKERYFINKKENEMKERLKKLEEEEKALMMKINWGDFIVVEVVDFEDITNTIELADVDVNANVNANETNGINGIKDDIRINATNTNTNFINVNNNNNKLIKSHIPVESYSINKINNEGLNKEPNNDNLNIIQKLAQNKEDNIHIIKNYDLISKQIKQQQRINDQTLLKCVFCNRNIPESEYDDHLKIELLDPKWKELKNEINKRKEERTLNDNSSMIKYLKEFTTQRPDLFYDSNI